MAATAAATSCQYGNIYERRHARLAPRSPPSTCATHTLRTTSISDLAGSLCGLPSAVLVMGTASQMGGCLCAS